MELLDTRDWKWFEIKELFKIKRGKRLIAENREQGDVFYYAASDTNNGLTDKISNPLFIEKNKIIYTVFGDSYYAPGEFTASDTVSILYNKNINEHNAIFICTILNKNKYKFSYGRQAYIDKLGKEKIKLPITKNNTPDWDYMEKYIKTLLEREREFFICWTISRWWANDIRYQQLKGI